MSNSRYYAGVASIIAFIILVIVALVLLVAKLHKPVQQAAAPTPLYVCLSSLYNNGKATGGYIIAIPEENSQVCVPGTPIFKLDMVGVISTSTTK